MRKIHAQRLLNVATALRESPTPKEFTMEVYVNACGSPACALGHYAGRGDLQRIVHLCLEPDGWGGDSYAMNYVSDADQKANPNVYDYADHDDPAMLDHFGLTAEESYSLFSDTGCGKAKTITQAANYIERFLAERDWYIAA